MAGEADRVANWFDDAFSGGGGGGGGYATIQKDGTPATQRAILNLVGGFIGITLTDDGTRTIATYALTAGSTPGAVPRWSGSAYAAQRLTLDDVDAAFTPTISFAAGGSAVECGQTGVSPTLNGSPQPNSGGGLTAYTISDNQGGGPTNRLGATPPFQGPVATYTAPSTPGSIQFSGSATKTGVTKAIPAISIPVDQRWGAGIDAVSGATGATASGNNMTLTGGGASATLTGALAATMIGTVFSYTISSGSRWVYALYPHTSTPGSFVDNLTGILFSMSVVATFTFTTQWGLTFSYDLYRSDFVQTVSRAVRRAS